MNSFFARLYEAFYNHPPFSDDLFQENVYMPLGILLLSGAVLMVLLFYYGINRPSFSRWYHWMIILAIHFGIQYGLAVVIPKNILGKLNLQYGSEYWTFALMHSIMATLCYILFSFLLRWWSKNCNRTPIPN
jgi:membrane-associated phospholipid phosphatase